MQPTVQGAAKSQTWLSDYAQLPQSYHHYEYK